MRLSISPSLLFGLLIFIVPIHGAAERSGRAATNNPLVGTIIWASFAIATLYIAGMMPIQKIMPNYTVDDYYRWWVIHLWGELTFEMFAVGVIAFFTVSLGLISHKTAVRTMVFELFLIMLSGTLGVGHHYWFQGLDEYWIAIGGIFSALEPLPLALMIVEAMKNQREQRLEGKPNEFSTVFMWVTGSAILNWIGAGFFGMVINTPTIDYYAHGTYLVMPHGHIALLGAFGYISIAFLYMTARAQSLAKGLKWDPKLSKWAFWFLTLGVLIFAIPTYIVGIDQAQTAFEKGYYFARLRETIEPMKNWLWFRLLPDTMMIIGGLLIFYDLWVKMFTKKKAITA
ncbi:MAG: cbb3-type cytochrome c oxidase subunit I [Bacteroidales bacterium]|nr:cbb3-type cytochrome c oxidase subunit I [Bacteroidales bacterium]